ncbi:MAG TPA: hypothetical protein VFC71_08645 [Candidatus Polarisedimenticolia bacterium]|nr:hypothetical protein [Candidatus Polarisedimenticolia bacterium]
MRRRLFTSLSLAGLLSIFIAGTALGAHCHNASKPEGAGVRGTVIVNAQTEEVSFIGANAAGRLPGGFADVWLDFDGDGVGDLQVENDVFLISNHSHKDNPAQGMPGVLPAAERDPGGPDHGVGFGD